MVTRRQILRAGGVLVGLSFPLLGTRAGVESILDVGGKIKAPPGGGSRHYAFADLEGLGLTSIEVRTPWYDTPCLFEGVLLGRLLEDVGATGEIARVSALDDYSADVPMSDIAAHRPLLALRRNGRPMPVDDKGPLFLVYDYGAFPELERQLLLSRSVWQVNRIEIV